MKRTLIAVTLAVATSAAFAQPTLDESPNPNWRNAPESTSLQTQPEAPKLTPAYEREQPFYFAP
ncbi:MAG TPA: hypothetical protein VML91_00350 [Burkholderiales bacterium]|nr:hypothetical protein [Burkholderiales bacterium]